MKGKFTFVALLFSCYLQAQSIKGRLQDKTSHAIEFATVVLHNLKDSTIVKGELTDASGNFEIIGVPQGQYFIDCSYVGFENYKSTAFTYEGANKDLGLLTMNEATQMINEVTVKARKPLIEIKADKTILNTDASITAAGSNGLELLRKAPGVTVDNNENIQLKGKNGVRIYIDGKPSYLTDKELANLLKSLNASDIESIEIITNPSAKYDAQGNAGIINLKLRKNKNYGTNGTINANAGYGKYHKAYAGINLNNRNKKINTFGSLGLGSNENWNSLNLFRDQDGRVFDQQQTQVNAYNPLNGKIGMDYYVNDKHTFGVLANVNTQYRDNVWESNSKTFISNALTRERIDSTLIASNRIVGNAINANANINYRYADTLGNELTIDLDKGYYDNMSTSMQPNMYVNGVNGKVTTERSFANETPSNIDINTAKIDYTKEIKSKALSIGMGGKYANVKSNNTFLFYNRVDGQNVKDNEQSNKFIYTENVAAAYVNVNGRVGSKFNYQLGLRMENTQSIGDLRREDGITPKPDDYIKRSYTNYFPSGAITYTANDKNAFNLTYSKRIERPSYQDLNPFEWRLDELTFRKGNPRLTPQYSDNVEFGYTANQMATVSLAYSKAVDVVTDIVERDLENPGRSYINYRNLASQENFAMTVSSPLPLKSWWNGYVSATMYKTYYKARFPEYTFDVATPIAYNVYMEHAFTLPKEYTFQISGWFNSASIWGGSWLSSPQGSLDLGVKKNLFSGRGNVKVSVTDILHTAPWSSTSDAIPGLKIRGNGAWESQQVTVNFSYRFGSKEVKGARDRKTGLEAEKGRIK